MPGRPESSAVGYSGTPVARKLGITPATRVALIGAPESVLDALPDGVRVSLRLTGRFEVIVAPFTERSALERRLPALVRALEPAGGLWLAWPKRSSGVASDLSDGVVRELGLGAGLVDNKVCAIDETWSGLRFVYRLRDRPLTA